MTADGDSARLTPDEAFAALGDETRLAILRTLGSAETPLGFSALYDRVDIDDTGGFNYHLDRLVGHFVSKGEDGYTLTRAGRRVVETVLSGAVTETPTLPMTDIEDECEYCGAAVEVRWREGSIERFCTACPGKYDRSYRNDLARSVRSGYLGRYPIPPAGLAERSPGRALRAAWTWGNLEILALSSGLCPRCSAAIDREILACEDHEDGDRPCPECGRRHALLVRASCTNCIYAVGGAAMVALTATDEVLSFLLDHGYNPVAPDSVGEVEAIQENYEEELLSTDPLRARFTLTADADRLELTVDENVRVLESARTE